MERVGHTLKQLPQSMQRSGRRTALPSRTRNASVGQIFMQREQPIQESSSIFKAWKKGVFSIVVSLQLSVIQLFSYSVRHVIPAKVCGGAGIYAGLFK
jgi:hypothetical protein